MQQEQSEVMNEQLPEEFLNLYKVIKDKDPTIARLIPGFIINYLNRIIHVKELNKIIFENRDKKDLDFIEAFLKECQMVTKVIGEENIQRTGRYIVASNHPLGGPDGLALMNVVGKYRKDIKFIVNDLLLYVDNLKNLFVPVNKHGSNTKEMIRLQDSIYSSDIIILTFPFGLVSRKRRKKIMDLEWKKSFITKAKQHKRDIIPVHIKGRNSNFFYNLSNIRKFFGIKTNIEMLYLVDEMFKQKDKDIVITFGTPISWQTFDKRYTDSEWAEKLRKFVYLLADNYKTPFDIDKLV